MKIGTEVYIDTREPSFIYKVVEISLYGYVIRHGNTLRFVGKDYPYLNKLT